jgi:hypothetical protein
MKPLEDSFCVSVASSLKKMKQRFLRIVFASLRQPHETEVTNIVKKMKQSFEDSFFVSATTSLKNETEVMSIVLVSVSSSLKNEIVFPLSI